MKPSKNPLSGEKAKAIIAEFPDASSHMLARMLYERHPRIYPTPNAARCAVRNQRGALGTMNRKAKGLVAPITPKAPRIELPASDERAFTPFIMDGCSRVLVLSDIHIPYHTVSALQVAIAEGKRRKSDGILLNGDTLDFHALSRFERNPEAKDFKAERALGMRKTNGGRGPSTLR